ncbi:ABC-type transport auxiliary lipoprotein family protein [Oceanisphaera avium]|uniref:ABC-type transport auxiliary lipoprotein component domain-containing protein n=1 Tax=Oceanisphaera avium TaxID=1903694 RepID=A0A1Y0D115_9GAMM|nr:ABC-type transport auxiliary lipoprotein family protein [Oceanisphaera avium]ART80785.1 hypothetical protein CBP12_11990 [Oceanisphaera avium]
MSLLTNSFARTCSILCLAIAGLAACSVLPKAEPVAYYRLPSSTLTPAPASLGIAQTVRIKLPDSSGLLNSNRMLVIPSGNELSAYHGARWATRLPILFRDSLLDVWLQSGRFQFVINDSQALAADRELGGRLNAFHSEYINGQLSVVIEFDAQWVAPQQRRLLASQRFRVTEPTASKELSAVVDAFGIAQARLSQQLLQWALASP